MYIRVIGKDMEYFRGKDVILFGGGSCGLRTLEEFEKIGSNIIAFCDNNRELAGTMLGGYKIIVPEQLLHYPNTHIIISSTFDDEIAEQLECMGLNNFYKIKLGVLHEVKAKETFLNPFMSDEDANQYILDNLNGKDPFFVGRLGSVELECLCHYLYFLRRATEKKCYPDNVKMMMNVNAGFFPSEEEMLDKFSELYMDSLGSMDLIWSMWFSVFEDKLYSEHYADKILADYGATVFPHDKKNPWTSALKGKKVLVIHPFEVSVQQNYKIKDKLFENKDFLPDFDLRTLKAVQSIAGNKTEYSNWFEALASMQHKIDQIDFDIALIGAGAYGLPLGAYIKRIGKKAVHVGGILQLFFGIKGKAWNKLGVYNEAWTSPVQVEIPHDFKKVEAGRYW